MYKKSNSRSTSKLYEYKTRSNTLPFQFNSISATQHISDHIRYHQSFEDLRYNKLNTDNQAVTVSQINITVPDVIEACTNLDKVKSHSLPDYVNTARRFSDTSRVYSSKQIDDSFTKFEPYEKNSKISRKTKKKCCVFGLVLIPVAIIIVVIFVLVFELKNGSKCKIFFY